MKHLIAILFLISSQMVSADPPVYFGSEDPVADVDFQQQGRMQVTLANGETVEGELVNIESNDDGSAVVRSRSSGSPFGNHDHIWVGHLRLNTLNVIEAGLGIIFIPSNFFDNYIVIPITAALSFEGVRLAAGFEFYPNTPFVSLGLNAVGAVNWWNPIWEETGAAPSLMLPAGEAGVGGELVINIMLFGHITAGVLRRVPLAGPDNDDWVFYTGVGGRFPIGN